MNNDIHPVVYVVLAIVLLGGAGWWQCAAPCSMHGCTPVKDLPARCLQ
jgi:hypothetical protein